MTASDAFMTPQIREVLAKPEEAEVNLDRAIVAAKLVEEDIAQGRHVNDPRMQSALSTGVEGTTAMGTRAATASRGSIPTTNDLEIDRRFGASSAATGRQSEPRKFDRTPSPRRSGPVLSATAMCICDWRDYAQSYNPW